MQKRTEALVVVGASLAGIRAAEAARAGGFTGSITLIGDEIHPPYDRPSLSKKFLEPAVDADAIHLTTTEELEAKQIQLALGERATYLDTAAGVVGTEAGEHHYSAAIIATGSAASTLPWGNDLDGVHTLRTLEDARVVRKALDSGARTVIVGGGFVGAEVATAARKRGLPVTIVEAATVPLVRAVGNEMGSALARLHERNGAELLCGIGVAGLRGNGRVHTVELADGREIQADLVVVGIGTRPATGWLEGSGLVLDDGVVCDAGLRSSVDGVFAAGDVARWTNTLFDQPMRIEHFTAAAEQGRWVGRQVAGHMPNEPFVAVPYFWSDWYGDRIQFVGVVTDDHEVVEGDLDSQHFVTLFRRNGHVVGALTLNGQRQIMKYRRFIADRSAFEVAVAYAASKRLAIATREA